MFTHVPWFSMTLFHAFPNSPARELNKILLIISSNVSLLHDTVCCFAIFPFSKYLSPIFTLHIKLFFALRTIVSGWLCVSVCLICVPMAVGQAVYKVWIYGEFMCKITTFLQGKHAFVLAKETSTAISFTARLTVMYVIHVCHQISHESEICISFTLKYLICKMKGFFKRVLALA